LNYDAQRPTTFVTWAMFTISNRFDWQRACLIRNIVVYYHIAQVVNGCQRL